MIADGLTKVLLKDGHEKFKRQIGLTDISVRLQERKAKELPKELDFDIIMQNE
jgi:hypothetical protein